MSASQSRPARPRSPRAPLARPPATSPARGRSSSESRRPAGRQLGRVGAQERRGPAGRLVPAAVGVDDDLVGARIGQPGAQRLAGRHLAEAQDEVGRGRSREALVAQQQVVGGDDVGAVVRPAAQLRGRLGEDREAGDPGEVGERLAQLRVELAAGDDHADDRRRRCGSATSSRRNWEGSRSMRRHRRQRPLVAPFQGQRVGRRHGALHRQRRQRLAPGKVEVDGAGRGLAARRGECPAGGRAVVEQAVVVGLVGADLAEPAHRRAVELQLVDRLPGADAAQLRRPVGGQGHQRDRRLVGLADRRVEVGGGGSRGAEDRHRERRSPAPRRARRRPPSARRRSPSSRSPAAARAPPPAASSASRGRGRRGAAPQRASSSTKAEASAVLALVGSTAWSLLAAWSHNSAPKCSRLEPVGLQRRLVDLDAEARAGGRVEHVAAQLALGRGDRRGEEALGGEAVGEVGRRRRPPRSGSARPGPPRRFPPGRRARWRRRRGGPRRSRSPPRARRPWRASPRPVWQAPIATARSASARLSMLSSPAIGIEVDSRQLRRFLQRRRPAARRARRRSGSSSPSVRFAVSRSQAPLASTRIRASRPDRLAHRPHLRRRRRRCRASA